MSAVIVVKGIIASVVCVAVLLTNIPVIVMSRRSERLRDDVVGKVMVSLCFADIAAASCPTATRRFCRLVVVVVIPPPPSPPPPPPPPTTTTTTTTTATTRTTRRWCPSVSPTLPLVLYRRPSARSLPGSSRTQYPPRSAPSRYVLAVGKIVLQRGNSCVQLNLFIPAKVMFSSAFVCLLFVSRNVQ